MSDSHKPQSLDEVHAWFNEQTMSLASNGIQAANTIIENAREHGDEYMKAMILAVQDNIESSPQSRDAIIKNLAFGLLTYQFTEAVQDFNTSKTDHAYERADSRLTGIVREEYVALHHALGGDAENGYNKRQIDTAVFGMKSLKVLYDSNEPDIRDSAVSQVRKKMQENLKDASVDSLISICGEAGISAKVAAELLDASLGVKT